MCRGFIQKHGYDTSYNALARYQWALALTNAFLAGATIPSVDLVGSCKLSKFGSCLQACGKEQQCLEPYRQEGQRHEESVHVW